MDLHADRIKPPVPPRLLVVFSRIERSAFDRLAEAMELPSPDPIHKRYQAGGQAFALWVENQIASYCWVSQGAEWIGEMETHFQMQTGEGYIWDCLTLPAFRKQGLYTALLGYMIQELHREGITRIWIGSNQENQASIRGFEKAGFQPIIQVWYFKGLGLSWFWIRPYPAAPSDFVSAARKAFSARVNRATKQIES